MKLSMIGGAILAAAFFGGGIAVGQIAGVTGSSAASPVATATTTQPGTGSAQPSFPAHGSATHEDAEKPVTGSAASKAQATAVKYLGGGTAGAVTTDFRGDGYEVTVTKSDGSTVEVHLDSSFNVQAGHGGFGGFGDNDGSASSNAPGA